MKIVDNNISSYSKYVKNEISWKEYKNEQVRKKGFKDINDYQSDLAKRRGFENWNEYQSDMRYKRDGSLSMSKNKNCPKYLGVHICENKEFLSKIINIVKSMPGDNPGYDVICVKNNKVNVKCACLVNNNVWSFSIKKNKIPDYFLMIAFDNRDNLSVEHIWLVKGVAVIEKSKNYNSEEFIFNEKYTVNIGKGNRALERWKKYEKTDILEEAQKLCDNFKDNNGDLNE